MSTQTEHRKLEELARSLQEALDQLGQDHASLSEVVAGLPEARAQLEKISVIARNSAEKVLDLTESAQRTQTELMIQMGEFHNEFMDHPASASYPQVGEFVFRISEQIESVNMRLTQIVIAQEFHDVTSHVTKSMIGLTESLEHRLTQVLRHLPSPAATVKPITAKPVEATSQRSVDDYLSAVKAS